MLSSVRAFLPTSEQISSTYLATSTRVTTELAAMGAVKHKEALENCYNIVASTISAMPTSAMADIEKYASPIGNKTAEFFRNMTTQISSVSAAAVSESVKYLPTFQQLTDTYTQTADIVSDLSTVAAAHGAKYLRTAEGFNFTTTQIKAVYDSSAKVISEHTNVLKEHAESLALAVPENPYINNKYTNNVYTNHPVTKTAAVTVATGVAAYFALPAVVSSVLSTAGFTSAGVVAGSTAAATQATFAGGNVVAGSWFAFFQSLGATGIASTTAVSAGAVAGAATAATVVGESDAGK